MENGGDVRQAIALAGNALTPVLGTSAALIGRIGQFAGGHNLAVRRNLQLNRLLMGRY